MGKEIIVVEYDPRWPELFCREELRIRCALGDLILGVEHVGSTAVVGLAAKPVIDVLVAIRDFGVALACIELLTQIGYEYLPEIEAILPGERRYFRRNINSVCACHLHMVKRDSAVWNDLLLFRDYLRVHPDEAGAYANMKRELAQQEWSNGMEYAKAKTAFVESILKAAVQERRGSSS